MEVKELRIGNLIHGHWESWEGDVETSSLGVCRVVGVDETSSLGEGWTYLVEGKHDEEIEYYDDFSGIPLTEEWHNRFGGEEKKGRFGKFYIYKVTDRLQFRLWLYEGKWTIGFYDTFNHILQNLCQIDFVHQWQNAFHSLTGQELTLNETK